LRILSKPFRITYWWIYRKLNNFNYVFRYDKTSPRTLIPEGFSVLGYNKTAIIPSDIISKLQAEIGQSEIMLYFAGVERYGCKLWIAFLGSEPVCLRLSRSASAIPRWFIPLNIGDQVCMKVYTCEYKNIINIENGA